MYSKNTMWIQKAELEDINSMLDLNYKIYPKEWHVSSDYVLKIMKKNPEVYNILKTSEGTKGIFSLFPLNKTFYDAILNGSLEESDLTEYLLDYSEPIEVYLYLISLIVDIHDPLRKLYARRIIEGMPSEIDRLERKGIRIKEIGAIAITNEGERVLPKIGFKRDNEGLKMGEKEYPVFRTTVSELKNAIRDEEK